MAVSDTDVKQIYQGNGSTTVFAIPFAFQSGDISHIKVYLRDETDADNITETLKTITTHYTLNSATVPTNVTMLSAPTSTQKLIIVRVSPLTQQTSFVGSGSFWRRTLRKRLTVCRTRFSAWMRHSIVRLSRLSGTPLGLMPLFHHPRQRTKPGAGSLLTTRELA